MISALSGSVIDIDQLYPLASSMNWSAQHGRNTVNQVLLAAIFIMSKNRIDIRLGVGSQNGLDRLPLVPPPKRNGPGLGGKKLRPSERRVSAAIGRPTPNKHPSP